MNDLGMEDYPIDDRITYQTFYPTAYQYGRAMQFGTLDPQPTSVYAHVPLCRSICGFCTYSKFELARNSDFVDALINATCAEISLWNDAVCFSSIRSLYIGGGTPSVLHPEQVERLVSAVLSRSKCMGEVSFEVHPRDATQDYLRSLRSAGVTRVSFGVQSFQAAILHSLGAHHDEVDSDACVENARAVGFENIAIDLLCAIPGQDLQLWNADLEHAARVGAPHVSTYRLIIDPAGPYGAQIRSGRRQSQPLGLDVQYVSEAEYALAAHGYINYGRCSGFGLDFAQPGYESVYELEHRAAPQGDLLAVGAGASGWLASQAYWTNHDMKSYVSQVADGRLPVLCSTHPSLVEDMRRYFVLGVKHFKVPFGPFEVLFCRDPRDVFVQEFSILLNGGFAVIEDDSLVITPDARTKLDSIAELFFSTSSRAAGHPYTPSLQLLSLQGSR